MRRPLNNPRTLAMMVVATERLSVPCGVPMLLSSPQLSNVLPDGRGELQFDVVWVAEWQDIDAESVQASDLAVRHGAFVKQAGGCFQVRATGYAEAQVIESDSILVEPITLRRNRPETEQQVP